ncbi:hypothetical protein J5N97_028801 [Dioscorea zingiberensis]|uniref:Uncharacterized protein n=1 Tax=Dioscorea zingiberensis TaxID=325984 RepID=A0A9D5H561_9LILI|nr:hypothetical protein J5N97_028801 [Dioscorea zingiberensis]
MAWPLPGISMDELQARIRGFIDILVLASGYQTSGEAAVWDPENIKRATQWGLFFEEVLGRLHESDDHSSSIEEIDVALLELTKTSLLPQGIASLSSKTLARARDLVLEHLVQRHVLKDEHLLALFRASVEMDVEKLGSERFKAYIATLPSEKDGFGGENSGFISQELLKRQASLACLSSVKQGLDVLSKVVMRNSLEERVPSGLVSPEKIEMLTEQSLWSRWRSKCLSYLLGDRTMRLLSGTNLIFSAPKSQWIRVFEPLKFSGDDNLLEIMEILLLGFISSRWSLMVEHFMSHSCDLLPISQQYSDIHHLLQENHQSLHVSKESMSSQENEILEYLTLLLRPQLHKLWQLPSVIVAAAIPSWSILCRMYLNELEKQFTGTSSIRCCDCIQAGKEHQECEVAERIWCLHIFHIRCSQDGKFTEVLSPTIDGTHAKE